MLLSPHLANGVNLQHLVRGNLIHRSKTNTSISALTCKGLEGETDLSILINCFACNFGEDIRHELKNE